MRIVGDLLVHETIDIVLCKQTNVARFVGDEVISLKENARIRQPVQVENPSIGRRKKKEKMEGWDTSTKSTLTKMPLLTTKAGPRDGAAWTQRLKEEYKALIAYTSMNKSNDNDWFRISATNPQGTSWSGKCWYVHNLLKYEFDLQFDIPVTYPATAPELELPQLDGKTHKMYRGGKICLTVHFKPLWAKNCPRFGIAHALCLGLAPWLAAEIPVLVDSGMIKHKDDVVASSSDSNP